jgi:hypothetical protein
MMKVRKAVTRVTGIKKVNLSLVGVSDNAFAVMGAFQRRARHEGWSREEIDAVLKEARRGDYNHLLHTIAERCIDGGAGEDEE